MFSLTSLRAKILATNLEYLVAATSWKAQTAPRLELKRTGTRYRRALVVEGKAGPIGRSRNHRAPRYHPTQRIPDDSHERERVICVVIRYSDDDVNVVKINVDNDNDNDNDDSYLVRIWVSGSGRRSPLDIEYPHRRGTRWEGGGGVGLIVTTALAVLSLTSLLPLIPDM